MPKVITLTNAATKKLEIVNYASEGYFQIHVGYTLIDDQGAEWSLKEMIRFSSGSGLPAEKLLPAAWEITFQNLITELDTKLTTLEGLD